MNSLKMSNRTLVTGKNMQEAIEPQDPGLMACFFLGAKNGRCWSHNSLRDCYTRFPLCVYCLQRKQQHQHRLFSRALQLLFLALKLYC